MSRHPVNGAHQRVRTILQSLFEGQMNSLVKKLLIIVIVMGLVAVGGWAGRKAYRKATEKRLLAEAVEYLDKKDFRNVGLCLQRVLQVNPLSLEANKMTADMLEATAPAAALGWRIRVAQLETNKVEYRFAWAQTALKIGDKNSALQALSGVAQSARSSPDFHKLAGALAWSANDAAVAEQHYKEALRLEPTNQTVVLNLATIRLTSTNPAVTESARLTLEATPTNSPLRALALRYLVADAETRKSMPSALRYSEELVSTPSAGQADKIARLELLRKTLSPEYKAWRANVEGDAKQSSEHAFAFGQWMVSAEGPTNAFHWLVSLPPAIQTNQPVPLILSDCRLALKDWKGLLGMVEKKDWGEVNFYRLALESLSQRSLENELLAKAAWQKSLRTASPRVDHMARLVQITTAWRWTSEKNEVLQGIVSKFPAEKWAADQLTESFYADGNTKGLADLLTKRHSADPADNRLKNNLASVSLLRKSDLANAHRMAREAYDSSPENPFYISTYAYSLLLQDKPDEAVKSLAAIKPEYLKIPAVAAYYGVVQAQAGHKDIARVPLNLAEAARMLPEEKEMVRMAKSKM